MTDDSTYWTAFYARLWAVGFRGTFSVAITGNEVPLRAMNEQLRELLPDMQDDVKVAADFAANRDATMKANVAYGLLQQAGARP